MSWNHEKFIWELDRKRLAKGVQAAAHERPQIAMNHVMELLQSSEATENQVSNALQLASDIFRLKAVSINASELFTITCGYTSHDSPRVRESAGRSAILQMLHGLVCPSQRLPVKLARDALPRVEAVSAMPTELIDEIRRLMVSAGNTDSGQE